MNEASKIVGVTKMVGYYWQGAWNKSGFECLKPNFGGKRPSKLLNHRKRILKDIGQKESLEHLKDTKINKSVNGG